jgi:methionyl-tRNA synthetase
MLAAVGATDDALAWPDDVAAALEALPAGKDFTVPENLFAKITDEMREAMEARFGGA